MMKLNITLSAVAFLCMMIATALPSTSAQETSCWWTKCDNNSDCCSGDSCGFFKRCAPGLRRLFSDDEELDNNDEVKALLRGAGEASDNDSDNEPFWEN